MVAVALSRPVHRDHRRQVDLRQHVAVEHDDRVADAPAGELDAAGRAERRRLDHVADADAQARAVTEHRFDTLGLVVEAQDDLVDLGHLQNAVDLVMQERPAEDGNDGLGRVQGQRAQSRALPTGEQNRLHDSLESYDRIEQRLFMNLPNALTLDADVSRAAAGRGAPDRVRGTPGAGRVEGAAGRGHLRARVADRLARRVPGAPAAAGDVDRPDAGSDRRQAADLRRVHLARAARTWRPRGWWRSSSAASSR